MNYLWACNYLCQWSLSNTWADTGAHKVGGFLAHSPAVPCLPRRGAARGNDGAMGERAVPAFWETGAMVLQRHVQTRQQKTWKNHVLWLWFGNETGNKWKGRSVWKSGKPWWAEAGDTEIRPATHPTCGSMVLAFMCTFLVRLFTLLFHYRKDEYELPQFEGNEFYII